jgi:multidrug efflux pump
VFVLAMTSDTHSVSDMFDTASSIVQQKLSQVEGVGQVQVVGGGLPAVRVQLNPQQLASYGLGPDDVAQVLSTANSDRPKGQLSNATTTMDITANDQISKAADYRPLVISAKDGSVIRLSDVASVTYST